MALSKTDKEELKNDPMVTFLSLLTGKDVSEIIDLLETSEEENKKNLIFEPNKKNLIFEPNKIINKKNFPIDKDEYDFLVKCAIHFGECFALAKKIGFKQIDTSDLNLIGAPLAIIYTLLRILVGSDFAAKFTAGLSKEGSDYFYKIYNDETRVY